MKLKKCKGHLEEDIRKELELTILNLCKSIYKKKLLLGASQEFLSAKNS